MNYRGLATIILLAMLWSPAFALMKYASVDYPPMTIAALRIGIAAFVLLGVCGLRRQLPSTNLKLWGHAAVMGFFSAGLPFTLFSYAITHILTMWGAVVTGTMPLLTAILSHFLLQEKLNRHKLLGILAGFSGILVLALPTVLDQAIGPDTYGLLACLVGSCSYAIGMVYSKRYFNVRGLTGSAMQLSAVSVWLLPLACLVEQPWHSVALSSAWSTLSLLGLGIICTAMAFNVYFWINSTFGASFLGMVGYPLPIFGVIIGVLCLGEPITLSFCLSLGLVLLGMMLMSRATHTASEADQNLPPPPPHPHNPTHLHKPDSFSKAA